MSGTTQMWKAGCSTTCSGNCTSTLALLRLPAVPCWAPLRSIRLSPAGPIKPAAMACGFLRMMPLGPIQLV